MPKITRKLTLPNQKPATSKNKFGKTKLGTGDDTHLGAHLNISAAQLEAYMEYTGITDRAEALTRYANYMRKYNERPKVPTKRGNLNQ